jgi:hypothetical protein
MSSLATALIVFAWLFGSMMLGFFLRGKMPQHHLESDSRDTVKLSVSGAIFLILEMDRPLTGVIRVSGTSVREALSHLGQRKSWWCPKFNSQRSPRVSAPRLACFSAFTNRRVPEALRLRRERIRIEQSQCKALGSEAITVCPATRNRFRHTRAH